MSKQTIPVGLFIEYVPEDLIGIPVTSKPNCGHMLAQLMLKLVQPFEGFNLFYSLQFKPDVSPMNRELVGNKGQINLLVGVRQS